MKGTFFKGVLLGALTSTVVLIAASAVAGTGVGAVFNLGRANTVNAQSTLRGATAGKNLQLTNTGTGSALGLKVAAGRAPLIVNSGVKVGNLNADRLDDLDSSDFLRSNGKAVDSAHADNADNATTAGNAGTLDGLDSTAFSRSRTYVLTTVTDGSANVSGTCPSGDLCFGGGAYCDTGDLLLGGGFDSIDNGTHLVTSEPFTPNPQDAWRLKWINNSTEDTVTIYTLCLDNGTPHA
jgi:hypothetical protein